MVKVLVHLHKLIRGPQVKVCLGSGDDTEDGEDAPGKEEVQATLRDADENQPTLLSVTEARIHGEKYQDREGNLGSI